MYTYTLKNLKTPLYSCGQLESGSHYFLLPWTPLTHQSGKKTIKVCLSALKQEIQAKDISYQIRQQSRVNAQHSVLVCE